MGEPSLERYFQWLADNSYKSHLARDYEKRVDEEGLYVVVMPRGQVQAACRCLFLWEQIS